jgi:hypothetical protein
MPNEAAQVTPGPIKSFGIKLATSSYYNSFSCPKSLELLRAGSTSKVHGAGNQAYGGNRLVLNETLSNPFGRTKQNPSLIPMGNANLPNE